MRPRAIEPDSDLRDILAEQPPPNPIVQEHWVQAGILSPGDAVGLPPPRGERDGKEQPS
jgi:hypothetical protein